MNSINLAYLEKDEADGTLPEIKEIMSTRSEPLDPKKLYVFTIPTKKESYGKNPSE